MRKLLMVAIVAVPTILVTPGVASARHCCFPCIRPCWSPCFRGPCFHGGCCRPFCGFGWRSCGFVTCGFCPTICWPSSSCVSASFSPFVGGPYFAPSVPYLAFAPAPAGDGAANVRDLRIAPPRVAASPAGDLPAPSRATVVVVLPAEARLLANGQPMATPSDRRTFATPELTPGKPFQYTFTAELLRDGKLVSQTKKVEVRAGEETQLKFEFPGAVASRK